MANEQAKAFIDQATQSLQNSQFQQALELIDQAIAIEPNVSDTHVLRGICLSQLGQPDAAVEAFRKAMLLSPYNAKAYYNLAVHYNSLGQKKEAADLAREAVGVDPRHSGARQLLGQLEQELMGVSNDPVGEIIDVAPKKAPMAPPPGVSDSSSMPPSARPPQTAPPSAQSRPQSGPGNPPAAGANPYGDAKATGQFSHQGFNRPGYVAPTSALPWVSGMGKAWVGIAWFLFFCWIPLIIAFVNICMAVINEKIQDPQKIMALGGGVVDVLYLLVGVLTLFWMICDTLDRRASGWWVAGLVVSTCCGLNILLFPIYLLVGRRSV
jgi:hypothetical protein